MLREGYRWEWLLSGHDNSTTILESFNFRGSMYTVLLYCVNDEPPLLMRIYEASQTDVSLYMHTCTIYMYSS